MRSVIIFGASGFIGLHFARQLIDLNKCDLIYLIDISEPKNEYRTSLYNELKDDKKIKIYQSSEDFFKAKSDQRVILITTKAKKIYTDFKFKINDTLLFGKESAGVPNKVHKILKQKIKIPMIAKKRSLNLSTSVAIILSESQRQLKL